MYFGSRTGGAQPVTFTLGAESGQRSRLHLLWEQNRGARPKRETFGNFLRGSASSETDPNLQKKSSKAGPPQISENISRNSGQGQRAGSPVKIPPPVPTPPASSSPALGQPILFLLRHLGYYSCMSRRLCNGIVDRFAQVRTGSGGT